MHLPGREGRTLCGLPRSGVLVSGSAPDWSADRDIQCHRCAAVETARVAETAPGFYEPVENCCPFYEWWVRVKKIFPGQPVEKALWDAGRAAMLRRMYCYHVEESQAMAWMSDLKDPTAAADIGRAVWRHALCAQALREVIMETIVKPRRREWESWFKTYYLPIVIQRRKEQLERSET